MQDAFIRDLPQFIASIFDETQQSAATHSRNCIALYKLHNQACKAEKNPLRDLSHTTNVQKTTLSAKRKLRPYISPGEHRFNGAFFEMIHRMLLASMPTGRSTKFQTSCEASITTTAFIAAYVKYIATKEASPRLTKTKQAPIYAPFVDALIKNLIPGLSANDLLVRTGVVDIFSAIVDSTTFTGDKTADAVTLLFDNLLDRCSDKIPYIRTQALKCLAKLYTLSPHKALSQFSDTITRDPESEIRLAALRHVLSIPLKPDTTLILQCTRDVNPAIRSLVFKALAPSRKSSKNGIDAAKSPLSLLSLQPYERSELLLVGLQDPDADVIRAVKKLLSDTFEGLRSGQGSLLIHGLTTFALLFELDTDKDRSVAVKALEALFSGALELVTVPAFPGKSGFLFLSESSEAQLADSVEFWTSLGPHQALVCYALIVHCTRLAKDVFENEEFGFPQIIDFAAFLQQSYDNLMLSLYYDSPPATMQMYSTLDLAPPPDEVVETISTREREVVIDYLLKLAAILDYGDELGRRRMFSLCTEMLAHPGLPATLLDSSLNLLGVVMSNEKDFVRVVVEAIVDMREVLDDIACGISTLGGSQSSDNSRSTRRAGGGGGAGDRSFKHAKERKDMSPEEKAEADQKDIRSLDMAIGMLKLIRGTMKENSTLDGLLADLIVPSVKRQDDLVLREKGIEALGLMCLLSVDLTRNAFPLIMNQYHASDASEVIKLTAAKSLMDAAVLFWDDLSEERGEVLELAYCQAIRHDAEDSVESRSVFMEGLCKVLAWHGDSQSMLERLVRLFFISKEKKVVKRLECFVRAYCMVEQSRVEDALQFFISLLVSMFGSGEVVEDGRVTRLCTVLLNILAARKEAGPIKVKLALDILRAFKETSLTRNCRMLLWEHVLDKIQFEEVTPEEKGMLEEGLGAFGADKALNKLKRRLNGAFIVHR